MKHFIFIIGVSFLVQSCIPVRTIIRPKITGYVFNADGKKPIENCNVNGAYTNSKGFYKLKKISYVEFVLIMVGPNRNRLQMRDDLFLGKKGYYNDTIKIQEPFGRNIRKGAHWKMDTIYLKAIN